ncbi:DUF1772 domain-containing protein [Streptomyces sp. TRM66268-LWL]|uniref:DUF1772 domain-containing protein n=1 Tax=Streptomyces polyasparticus TaxID=2767826 RepID=A0ABR7STC0_9ACTN|nr:anthrone oxygenase family protein [Streptomyces polyasparticus]MBC9718202.1 DUF1772 domain-containing protein [Streptomyces polyasparticus]
MTTTRIQGRRTGSPLLIAAVLVSGLMAGVWFAYATSVMGALGRADDRTFISVMQDINEVIQNPAFFLALFGALVLPAVAAWRVRGDRPLLRWVLAGLLLYVGVFVVTSGASVPLNDQLAAAGDPAKIASPGAVREDFEDPWVLWNLVRCLLNVAAVVCLSRALAIAGRRAA